MDKAVRVLVALPALLFGISGIQWMFAPEQAAAGLGMSLPDGIARSTMIGDIGAFFLALSAMIAIGVISLQRTWLLASAMVVATAAVMRVLAWALHDAAFATQFIAVEVVVAGILFFGGNKITSK